MNRLRPYYPLFKFVAVFGSVYLLLSVCYYFYLNQDYTGVNYPDPVTSQVAYHTQQLLNLTSYEARIFNSSGHPSVFMYLNKQGVYRVIEGCNAMSVMILFVSFVLAFAKAWKKTALYILIGLLLIYLVNILRLVALAIIKYEYPEYDHISHEILFPAVIYGMVILLWLYWIKSPKKS